MWGELSAYLPWGCGGGGRSLWNLCVLYSGGLCFSMHGWKLAIETGDELAALMVIHPTSLVFCSCLLKRLGSCGPHASKVNRCYTAYALNSSYAHRTLIPIPVDTPFFLSTEIVDQPGLDIFGQVYNQWKNKECVCPNCSRSIAASRFAPHLEKCLGMGRNSSRIANRRWGIKEGRLGCETCYIAHIYVRLDDISGRKWRKW